MASVLYPWQTSLAAVGAYSHGSQSSSLSPLYSLFQAIITNRSQMTHKIKFISLPGLNMTSPSKALYVQFIVIVIPKGAGFHALGVKGWLPGWGPTAIDPAEA